MPVVSERTREYGAQAPEDYWRMVAGEDSDANQGVDEDDADAVGLVDDDSQGSRLDWESTPTCSPRSSASECDYSADPPTPSTVQEDWDDSEVEQ